MTATTSAMAPLREPPFRKLWAASVLSHVGTFLHTVAASWLMLELTGSPLWVSLMVAAPRLPLLVMALPAGALADLVERRRILIAAQFVMTVAAVATAAFDLSGALTPGLLLALGLLLGLGQAFNVPAWQAMVPDLVPTDQVPGAVALNSVAFNVARAVGPALGGAIVATAGPSAAFLANAVSYLAIVAALVAAPRGRIDETEPMLSAISSGLRYARFTPAYRWLLLITTVFAVTSAVVQAMLPNLSADVFGVGAAGYGVLLGALGVGALVGAVTRPRAIERLTGAMIPVGIVGFGCAGLALGLSPSLPWGLVALAGGGVFWIWTLSTLNATTQMLSPAWVRGRIMSLYTLAFLGFVPVGAILAGSVGDVIGPAGATIALSTVTVALGLLAARLPLPVLGRVQVPRPPEDYAPLPHPPAVAGGPVMVVNTWVIDEAHLNPFLDTMEELRRVRLRTGAFRWRLYRNVSDAHRMTEVFLVRSWEGHLRQHRRMDADAVAVLQRAAAMDQTDGPVTHHLAAIDVTDPARRPGWEQLVAQHERLHEAEGAFRLER